MYELKLIIKPDEEEPGCAEVLVDGTIGSRPYRFLLDTGAGKSSITFDDYTATFDTADQHHSSGVFAKSSSDLITVPDLTVGSISKANFTVTRTAIDDPHIKNLIGMDFLKNLRCHFLFDEDRVTIDAPPPDCDYLDLITDTKFHPYLDMYFGTAKASAVWDTGASITIADMTFINNHPDLFKEVGTSTGTDSAGASMETPMFMMAASTIGQHTFPPCKVAGVDLSFVNSTIEIPMDLILGYNLLSKANWIFDFPLKKWAITSFKQ